MNMVALIEKKKHGDALDNAEIEYIVRGAADGTIPDYQLAAFLMAVCFTGTKKPRNSPPVWRIAVRR